MRVERLAGTPTAFPLNVESSTQSKIRVPPLPSHSPVIYLASYLSHQIGRAYFPFFRRVNYERLRQPRVTQEACVAIVQVKDLLDAGVHYGHRASRWNPKMRPY